MQLEDLSIAYEEEVADFAFRCRKGCAACCTRSVNMTTMEGARILHYLEAEGRPMPDLFPLADISVPPCTINHAAACFLEEKLPPAGEDEPWEYSPCLFLEDAVCTIYPVRPFGCRSFGSTVDCLQEGSAEAPEWFISLNLFIMQVVEDLDRDGYWGNIFEVLGYLSTTRGREKLLKNEIIPGFPVPVGDRQRVISFLARLRVITGEDLQLKDIYKKLGRSISG